MNKKGQVTMYLIFMIAAIMIIVVASFMAPMGIAFNTEMWKAGEEIINMTQKDLNEITDTEMRDHINDTINAGREGIRNNIDVNAAIFQYGWILVIALVALIIFLYTRRMVEVTGGFV